MSTVSSSQTYRLFIFALSRKQNLSCFPHFFGTPSETLVNTIKFFYFECPEIKKHVYKKKAQLFRNLSVQVIQKINGRYKVLKTLGSATMQQEIELLVN